MSKSLLDQEPIYCVEQIKIPNGLPTLLKTFAKEVIRAQPENLEEFALTYFQNLLTMIKLDVTAPPPTMEQLVDMYQQTKDLEYINQKPLAEIAKTIKIHDAAIENVFKLANFPSDLVDPKEFILLMLTCTAKSFVAVLRGIFKLFGAKTGEKIPTPLFFLCAYHLAKRDKEIDLKTLANLEEEMKIKELKEVSLEDIQTNPNMVEYFKSDKEKSLVS
ncbi:hypothetical protein KC19_VG265300 [Ceratodon purpureus]|uniref:RIIa domain-containing protein n=1 Tax=Ceratodon purpureus TaxID=3225 RepID=A0A8T0HTX0_CERPU|nr:hypothetical protein KC19_VG265300 [Ceratodon purpureus]